MEQYNLTLKVIAYARNVHTDKFGIPRQSGVVDRLAGQIVFEPEYRDAIALRGIEARKAYAETFMVDEMQMRVMKSNW